MKIDKKQRQNNFDFKILCDNNNLNYIENTLTRQR